jgi:hypothetical protein
MRSSRAIPDELAGQAEIQAWVEPLAKAWRVIAVEMQGHGRTADADRPMNFPAMGEFRTVVCHFLRRARSVMLIGRAAHRQGHQ